MKNDETKKLDKKRAKEQFNPDITRHFGIAHRAYLAAVSFGAGLLSTIQNELADYGIVASERDVYRLIGELEIKTGTWRL